MLLRWTLATLLLLFAALPASALELHTDKDVYAPGEDIQISAFNDSSRLVSFGSSAPYYARNVDTGLSRGDVTGAAGGYQINLLPPGTYDVRADLAGFKSEIKRGVNVGLGSAVDITFLLQASAVEEEIVVTAEAPVVETTNPSVTAAVSDEAIANLPLVGRDFTDFIKLTPGSVSSNRDDRCGIVLLSSDESGSRRCLRERYQRLACNQR